MSTIIGLADMDRPGMGVNLVLIAILGISMSVAKKKDNFFQGDFFGFWVKVELGVWYGQIEFGWWFGGLVG